MITITITAPAKGQARLRVDDPGNTLKDLAPVRQLVVQALVAIEGEVGTLDDAYVPTVSLALLRNFLNTTVGDRDSKARRLLLMALMQMDDEDSAKRFQVPVEGLPILTK